MALGLCLTACVRAPAPAPVPGLAGPSELWVDAFAPEGGDGGVAAALREVPRLSEGARLHLRSGLYRGPFSFAGGTRVEGHGQVVLYVEGTDVVVTADAPLALVGVSVQGGSVGLLARASVSLDRVKFSGHRTAAVQAWDGGVRGGQVEIASRLGSMVGLDAINGRLDLDEVTLQGPMQQGVRAADSDVRLDVLRSEGPATALQVLRGTARVSRLSAAGGQLAAVLLVKARASLEQVEVTGHEYGLLGTGAEVTVGSLTSRGPAAAGVSLVDSTVRLVRAEVSAAGPLGGLQLLGCTSTVDSASVTDSRVVGVLVRKGRAALGSVTVQELVGDRGRDGTVFSGDALEVRDGEVELGRLDASGLDGAGLYASNNGRVKAGSIEVSSAGFGAVVVERKSRVRADRVVSRGSRGPSVAAPEDGELWVKTLTAQGGDVAVWADCDSGSKVTVLEVTEGTTLPRLRCLAGPPAP